MWSGRRTGRGCSGAAVVAASAVLLTGCGHPAARPASASGGSGAAGATIAISLSACGRGWTTPHTGRQTFTVQDTDSRSAEVTLVDPASGAVYASLEPLAPGRSAALPISLGPGRYAFVCAMEDEDPVTGPTVTVRGPMPAPAPVSPVLPVSEQDLIPAAQAYQRYVEGALPALAAAVTRLQTDLVRGDRAAAKRDWLTAHLAYERLGAAYDAFGDADAVINGLPSGLSDGLRDKDFTGFHAIEYGLWHGVATGRLVSETRALHAAIVGLHRHFATAEIDPGDIAIRAHEITENALEFELTGRTDFGSHSALATVRANLDGTLEVLRVMHGVLAPRYPELAATTASVERARTDLDRLRTAHGWPALSALPQTQRELIDSDISELSEQLSDIAAICEPRVLS